MACWLPLLLALSNPGHLQGSTFGIPGVEQHALFLREVRGLPLRGLPAQLGCAGR